MVFLFLFVILSGLPCPASDQGAMIHHDMNVKIIPQEHWIHVEDTITLPDAKIVDGAVSFVLHGNLAVNPTPGGAELKELSEDTQSHQGINSSGEEAGAVLPVRHYSLLFSDLDQGGDSHTFTLVYEGMIHHAIQSDTEEYARSFSQTPGIIDEEGTMLSAGSYWYPRFDESLVTFTMEVELPQGRKALSQGRRLVPEDEEDGSIEPADSGDTDRVIWDCPDPMDDIYLIEADFTEYSKSVDNVTALVFLRQPDPGLAAKYLDATAQYVQMYSELIGPYPFAKFALIENFWETGYGMPSFTLLGPKVIRFPFILHTSYPHEILHNWWGNSVFVAYEQGNWCEGITAYLADHLLKEIKGQGESYRRDTLQRYLDYVRNEKDFPLREFRARHDAATEAIGYGKSLMLYHMLRIRIGDEAFVQGLKDLYEKFKFKRASFNDIEKIFTHVSEEDLGPFFSRWIERAGAPDIRVIDHTYEYSRHTGAYLKIVLQQMQEEEPFPVTIPIAVHMAGQPTAAVYTIEMENRKESFSMQLPEAVVKVEVDPYFDVFRKLDREEVPPTIGQAFGAENVLIVLPENETYDLSNEWRSLAERWASDRSGSIEIREESELDAVPDDRAVWIFGRQNRWRPGSGDGLNDYGVQVEESAFTLAGEKIPFKEHMLVVALRHPGNPDLVRCWVTADLAAGIPGLGRKLPHYGKYSFLAFEGEEPTNISKGQWPLDRSPLVLVFDQAEASKNLSQRPARPALAEPPSPIYLDNLKAHVAFLADDRMKGRGLGTPELDEAAEYIARLFSHYGLVPGGETGSFFQAWFENIETHDAPVLVKNVIGKLPGNDPKCKNEWVVVGAHYDHLGLGWPDVHTGDEGKIHNGADDNASGVAVLLELARMLGLNASPAHSIAFVAFTGEEAGLRGSRRFIEHAEDLLGGPVVSMVNLDTVGRLGDGKLLVFGTDSAREWPFIAMGAGYTTGLDVQNVPKDPGTGDQVSFLESGIPAVHLFSGIHSDYHRPSDDPDKIDFEGMAKITEFAKEIVVYLGDRREPLDVKIAGKESTTTAAHPGGGHPGGSRPAGGHPGGARPSDGSTKRRASLGTMPDFSWPGPGVRIASVSEGSPAESAGLKAQDIITALNDLEVADLRGLADALKAFEPGEKVTVHYKRDTEVLAVDLILTER